MANRGELIYSGNVIKEFNEVSFGKVAILDNGDRIVFSERMAQWHNPHIGGKIYGPVEIVKNREVGQYGQISKRAKIVNPGN